MAYIKCPRCELNYIPDSEKLCAVCKMQTGYDEPLKRRDIEYIYEYISRIYGDFQQYLNTAEKLCDLKSITFEGGYLPDYGNLHIQQLYILRYSYAYAYHYKSMYNHLFQNYGIGADISVTSIGCGNMIDYWSLVEALYDNRNENCRINYTGLDAVDWQYKVRTREKDTFDFKICNAVEYFTNADKLDSDVYVFPMSISEFSNDEFGRLCECFQNKPVLKDRFCVLVPMRVRDKSMVQIGNISDAVYGADTFRVDKLVSSITQNGFSAGDFSETINFDIPVGTAISNADYRFHYPDIANQLKYLIDQCKRVALTKADCAVCDKQLNRSPMLTTGYVTYRIFVFGRA